MIGEDRGIPTGLGGDELPEGELPTRDGQVLARGPGHLEVDPGGWPTLVVLAGGV